MDRFTPATPGALNLDAPFIQQQDQAALVEPCILAGSKEGDTVLDPFAGSGTTGAVALRYHREFMPRSRCELSHCPAPFPRAPGAAPMRHLSWTRWAISTRTGTRRCSRSCRVDTRPAYASRARRRGSFGAC
jgi:hypothetical protein